MPICLQLELFSQARLHQFTTLGALTICRSGTKDQTTLLVVAEIEDFIFKLFQFPATQPHSPTGLAILKIDAVALRWY